MVICGIYIIPRVPIEATIYTSYQTCGGLIPHDSLVPKRLSMDLADNSIPTSLSASVELEEEHLSCCAFVI